MADEPQGDAPWWASGRTAEDGLDGTEDPLGAHWGARHGDGATDDGPADGGAADDPGPGGSAGAGGDAARLAGEAIDLFARLAAEAGRRVASRATTNAGRPAPGAFTRTDPPASGPGSADGAPGPHPHDGEVCDACPVCMGLRAIRQVRPEVVAHLSDAAHHLSLALRAVADAQAQPDDGLESIDLDP